MEKWRPIINALPFILSAGQNHKINKTRVLETVIMAAVVAGFTYGAFSTRVENIEKTLTRFQLEIRSDMQHMSKRIDNLHDRRLR